jgi:hypothetical protein
MKKHITLVFEYESDSELQVIREAAKQDSCRAWSMDHDLLRIDLICHALEREDYSKAEFYANVDGAMAHLGDLK